MYAITIYRPVEKQAHILKYIPIGIGVGVGTGAYTPMTALFITNLLKDNPICLYYKVIYLFTAII